MTIFAGIIFLILTIVLLLVAKCYIFKYKKPETAGFVLIVAELILVLKELVMLKMFFDGFAMVFVAIPVAISIITIAVIMSTIWAEENPISGEKAVQRLAGALFMCAVVHFVFEFVAFLIVI